MGCGFRIVKNFVRKSFSITVEADAGLQLKAAYGLDIAGIKAQVYALAGPKVKASVKARTDGNAPYSCINLVGYLGVSVGAEIFVFKEEEGILHEK